jgi:hypothetical protein
VEGGVHDAGGVVRDGVTLGEREVRGVRRSGSDKGRNAERRFADEPDVRDKRPDWDDLHAKTKDPLPTSPLACSTRRVGVHG